MAEQQKQVWEKTRDNFLARVRETQEFIIKTGQSPEWQSLSSIVDKQRAFQKACKPVSSIRDKMFERQLEGHDFVRAGDDLWREMLRVNVLACVAEMIELLETCPWKPWKTSGDHAPGRSMEEAKLWEARLEVIDALCFLMNCWMLLGGDGAMMADLYAAKMDENHARQKGGY